MQWQKKGILKSRERCIIMILCDRKSNDKILKASQAECTLWFSLYLHNRLN